MYTIEATYRVVTPLFAGGADQRSTVEIRPTAFKGVLRFWYRAVTLPFYGGELQKVKEKERELFGSTDGQASFMLKLETVTSPGEPIPKGTKWETPGSAYLGYGVIGWNRDSRQVETSRPCLKEGFSFTVTLAMPRQKAESADTAGLKRALIALGLFGGLGSRSRKGFGSLALESLVEKGKEIWTAPGNVEELRAKIQELFRDMRLGNALPEYTAFSGQSRVAVWPSSSGALELLDEVGREMVRYRSYGQRVRDKRIILDGETPNQIFWDDHDLVRDVITGQEINSHPRRVVFGLPHNYRMSGKTVKVEPESRKLQRRGSPLFIHIHRLTSGNAAVFTFLPAKFLPGEEKIQISVVKGKTVTVDQNVDYGVIHDFIDRFPNRLEVLP